MVEINALLKDGRRKKTCTRTALQSVLGSLRFAATCVATGRVYIRRMINFLTNILHNFKLEFSLKVEVNLSWCIEFSAQWQGKLASIKINWSRPDVLQFYINASATLGVGRFSAST